MKPHPLAEELEMVSEAEIKVLADDIEKNGLHYPVLLYEGMILDGRCRQLACDMKGLKPRYEQYTGDDPWDCVMSLNVHRRHLTDSQRAVIAAKHVTTAGPGRLEARRSNTDDSVFDAGAEKAAASVGVSQSYVQTAKTFLADATPEEVQAVEAGKKTLPAAAKAVKKRKAAEAEPELPRPDRVKEAFAHAEALQSIQKNILSIRRELGELCETSIGAWLDKQQTHTDLTNVNTAIKFATPAVTCPKCGGEGCKQCKESGWLPKGVAEKAKAAT